MQKLLISAFAVLFLSVLPTSLPAQSAITPTQTASEHVLTGAWLATDGTVFIFRKDGTFHGFDYDHKEIWGTWVILSASRIGFQSLLHTSSYEPQYAIIDNDTKDSMQYIVAAGNSFIKATRLPIEKAEAAVEVVVEPQVHHPGEAHSE